MPTTEERVAYLEGKVEEHSSAWQDLREAIRETNQRITHLEQKIDQRFGQVEERINHLEQKFDQRFIGIDQRIYEMDQRINQRIDRLFFFILATLVSSIGSLIAVLVSIFVR